MERKDSTEIQIIEDNKSITFNNNPSSRAHDKSIDAYITMCCLERSVGELALVSTRASNLRQAWVCQIILDAILNANINLIDEIAKRIDGSIPSSEDRDEYANILGGAIEDVMDYTSKDQCIIKPDDPCIIALAKAAIAISLDSETNNPQRLKAKEKAVNLILSRCGGSKNKPVKEIITENFIEPKWMKGKLGEGNVD